MPNPAALLTTVAGGRYSRQIVSRGAGAAAIGTAGALSISAAWPTTAGSVTANVRNVLTVALKPGTANTGSVTTPAGWTPIGTLLGGGYGATLGVDTGNCHVYVFYRDNINTASGSLSVTLVPNGANGVACATMERIEKLSGSWGPIEFRTGESTTDTVTTDYPFSASLVASPGDLFYYAWAFPQHQAVAGSTITERAGFINMVPSLSSGSSANVGNRVHVYTNSRRCQRGQIVSQQEITLTSGVFARGPMLAVRFRVR